MANERMANHFFIVPADTLHDLAPLSEVDPAFISNF
jgi:hypothetical protein